MKLIVKDYTGIVCINEFEVNTDYDYEMFCEYLADYVDNDCEVVVYEKIAE